jgi:hypothetical protein
VRANYSGVSKDRGVENWANYVHSHLLLLLVGLRQHGHGTEKSKTAFNKGNEEIQAIEGKTVNNVIGG